MAIHTALFFFPGWVSKIHNCKELLSCFDMVFPPLCALPPFVTFVLLYFSLLQLYAHKIWWLAGPASLTSCLLNLRMSQFPGSGRWWLYILLSWGWAVRHSIPWKPVGVMRYLLWGGKWYQERWWQWSRTFPGISGLEVGYSIYILSHVWTREWDSLSLQVYPKWPGITLSFAILC